ncbi:MAG: LpxD N-terminal domain-containing protein, partial [Caulobacteraceae bacterium]
MPDPRFYETLAPASVSELASLTGAELADAASGGRVITAAAPLLRADTASVSFLSDRKHLADLRASVAGACFVAPANAEAAPQG